ncbi:MAG: hypothetical protein DRP11_04385 [Candidatus Aenigmatarchaeota archaeon]|nr:MAG: hypothetical protein DRP11_04385 [Candidatus Aenigmarchaeota archaeon]
MSGIYDSELDVLSINGRRKTYTTTQIGDIIIDFDRNLNVAGIEIMNPDKYLGITKKLLKQMKYARISAHIRNNILLIRIFMVFVIENKKVEKERSILLPLARN